MAAGIWTYTTADVALTNGDTTATCSTSINRGALGEERTSGKLCVEFAVTGTPGNTSVGVASTTANLAGASIDALGGNYLLWRSSGQVWLGASYQGALTSYTTGDRVGVAVDFALSKAWLIKNGTAISGSPSSGTGGFSISGALAPAVHFETLISCNLYAIIGNQLYAPPSGFSAWSVSLTTVGLATGFRSTAFGQPRLPPFATGFSSTSFGQAYAKATHTNAGAILDTNFGQAIEVPGWTATFKHGRTTGIHSTNFGSASTLMTFIASAIKSSHVGSPMALANGKTGFATGFKSPMLGTPVSQYVINHSASSIKSSHVGAANARYARLATGFCSTYFGSHSGPRPAWLDYESITVHQQTHEIVVNGL